MNQAVATYRVVAGIALAVHFARRAAESLPDHSGQRMGLAAACALLSVLVAVGHATALAALVLNVLAVTFYGLTRMPTLNDYLANVAALVLFSMTAGSSEQSVDAPRDRTGLGSILVFMAVVGVYVGGGPFAFFVDSGRGSPWVRWAFRATAIAMVAPARALRRASVLAQLCLHGFLFIAGPYRLAHVVFGASPLLFTARPGPGSRLQVDLAGILSLSVLATAGSAFAAARFGYDVSRSARVLAAIGLLPLPGVISAPEGNE
jgi:hypothetical protein